MWQIKTEDLKDHSGGQVNEVEGKPKFWVLVSDCEAHVCTHCRHGFHSAGIWVGESYTQGSQVHPQENLSAVSWEALGCPNQTTKSFFFSVEAAWQWRHAESRLSKPMGVQ